MPHSDPASRETPAAPVVTLPGGPASGPESARRRRRRIGAAVLLIALTAAGFAGWRLFFAPPGLLRASSRRVGESKGTMRSWPPRPAGASGRSRDGKATWSRAASFSRCWTENEYIRRTDLRRQAPMRLVRRDPRCSGWRRFPGRPTRAIADRRTSTDPVPAARLLRSWNRVSPRAPISCGPSATCAAVPDAPPACPDGWSGP
jgi:hypothetical protein